MDDPKVKKIFFLIKIFKYPNSKSYHPKVKFQDLLPKCVLSFAKLSLEVEIIYTGGQLGTETASSNGNSWTTSSFCKLSLRLGRNYLNSRRQSKEEQKIA